MKKEVYLDHAATTPMRPEVLAAMEPYWFHEYGNPSALYTKGRKAKVVLDSAREIIAGILHCDFGEIIFTGSGTESTNLAVLGMARKNARDGACKGHIITTQLEHHAVLYPCEYLGQHGYEVTYLQPDQKGIVTPEQVIAALREDTILVSVMYANNEIGTIEPIADIGRAIRMWKQEHGRVDTKLSAAFPYFYTDACQAAGSLNMRVDELYVDALTMNGSKLYGPKGVGALYLRKGIKIEPLVFGGGQEYGLRSGTESVPLIMGLAEAFKLSQAERTVENIRLIALRDWFIHELETRIAKVVLNGPRGDQRLPNNVHVSIYDVEGEALLLLLDEAGIYASTGSACNSGTLEPSHVLMACGVPREVAHGSLRLTLGKHTTQEDLQYVMGKLIPIVERLRTMSPVNISLKNTACSIKQKQQERV